MVKGIAAQRGSELRCRNWRAEGLLRMLENVLEVGQDPDNLIVYASLAKAARDWNSYDAIRAALLELADNETLMIQSGKPVLTVRTSAAAPIVIMANNNVVGRYATSEVFYERHSAGQTVWPGLTAGAWQYIGSQGVLQGTYETLQAVARAHFGGSLSGRTVVTSGLGGMGSAQPTAINMAGAAGLVVEVDQARLAAAAERGVIDAVAPDLDDAWQRVKSASLEGRSVAIGIEGNAAAVYSQLVERRMVPDLITDMTAAHDLRYGYAPVGLSIAQWQELRESEPDRVIAAASASIASEVRAVLALRDLGAVAFESGNNLRLHAFEAGVDAAMGIDSFMSTYIRPLFCEGIGPFRWIALSGEQRDLDTLDELASDLFPERPEVVQWIELARQHVPVQGLPARSCWLGHGERGRFALATNALVAAGELQGPVLFTRDHLDSAGMTHPFIGTENMQDGSDAVADWPLLDAMLLCATGADLVAIHGGGGGYAGLMQSAGVSIVADGTREAVERLGRTLDADTGLGVARYAEAGYPSSLKLADQSGLKIPLTRESAQE